MVVVASILLVGGGVLVREVRSSHAGAPPAADSASATPLGDLPSGASAALLVAPPIDNGCDIPDRGMGDYVEKHGLPLGARLFVRNAAVDAEGDYALLVHFHGGEAAKKLLLPQNRNLIIAVLDRGNGSSAYEPTFSSRKAWDDFLGVGDRLVTEQIGRPAHASRIYVSSWSAGYKAVEDVLRVAGDDTSLRGLVLLDSLHASYLEGKPKLEHGQLETFVAAARRATTDASFFFTMVHSEIKPAGYASTTETAAYVLSELGLEADVVREGGRDQLPQTSVAHQGRLSVRGYTGNDPSAHCAQLSLLPAILDGEHVE